METKKKVVKKKVEQDDKKEIHIKKFDDLEGKFLLVKVGSDDRPATDEDIDNVRNSLIDLFNKNGVDCLAYVTHHCVEMEIVEKLK